VRGSSELLLRPGEGFLRTSYLCHWPVCLQGTKGDRGICAKNCILSQVRCQTDIGKKLILRVQSSITQEYWGGGRRAHSLRSLGHLVLKEERDTWGSPGQGRGPERRRCRQSSSQKHPGSAELDWGRKFLFVCDIC